MVNEYPLRFPSQLRQHLRALRKSRHLTQAQLGDLVGVSQARIAEIEANPGLVRFEQLMQLLSALDVTLSLSEDLSSWHTPERARRAEGIARTTPKRPSGPGVEQSAFPNYSVQAPQGWRTTVLRTGPSSRATGVLETPAQADVPKKRQRAAPEAPPGAPDFSIKDSSVAVLKNLPTLSPHADVQPTSRRNFIVRSKKGIW